jgi:hypothetical protein
MEPLSRHSYFSLMRHNSEPSGFPMASRHIMRFRFVRIRRAAAEAEHVCPQQIWTHYRSR